MKILKIAENKPYEQKEMESLSDFRARLDEESRTWIEAWDSYEKNMKLYKAKMEYAQRDITRAKTILKRIEEAKNKLDNSLSLGKNSNIEGES
jgi:hypothetical protein